MEPNVAVVMNPQVLTLVAIVTPMVEVLDIPSLSVVVVKRRMELCAILTVMVASMASAQSAGRDAQVAIETTVLSALNLDLMEEVLVMQSGIKASATERTLVDVRNRAQCGTLGAVVASIMLDAAYAHQTAKTDRQILECPVLKSHTAEDQAIHSSAVVVLSNKELCATHCVEQDSRAVRYNVSAFAQLDTMTVVIKSA